MGENTGVEWAHHTHNEWWGCEKISPGCKNCYADEWDSRFGGDHWGAQAPRRFFGEQHTLKPLKWDASARARGVRERVFAFSMGDWAEDRDDLLGPRAHLFETIRQTTNLDWLLLTKRPWNAQRMLPWAIRGGDPWPQVWLGTTAENQEEWERRRPFLRDARAVVKFVSYEPALERIDFQFGEWAPHWLISGAESGRRARPAELDWFRDARDQAQRAGVSYFFKQLIEGRKKVSLPMLDGRQWAEVPR